MPNYSITTTLRPTVFTGDLLWLEAVTFKNGSTVGIIYMMNKANRNDTLSSTVYDFSLTSGQSVAMNRPQQGEGIIGPWDAISDTAGGVTLEVVPFYKSTRSK